MGLLFDGNQSVLTFDNNSIWNWQPGEIIEVIFRSSKDYSDQIDGGVILRHGTDGLGHRGWDIRIRGGAAISPIRTRVWDEDFNWMQSHSPVEGPAYNDGNWHHVISKYWYASGAYRLQMWVDGVNIGADSEVTFGGTEENIGLVIGGQTVSRLDGDIALIRKTTSTDESFIRSRSFAGKRLASPSPTDIFYIPCREGTGTSVREWKNNLISNAIDTSHIFFRNEPVVKGGG